MHDVLYTHPHGEHHVFSMGLVICHLLVPHGVKLLELKHMSLFHSEPLSDLSRAHGLLEDNVNDEVFASIIFDVLILVAVLR